MQDNDQRRVRSVGVSALKGETRPFRGEKGVNKSVYDLTVFTVYSWLPDQVNMPL